MKARLAARLLGCGLAAAAGVCSARAQEAAPAGPSKWTGSLSAYWYLLPDDENYVLPIVMARRDRLHLEARFNYEDRDTGSFFGGWTFAAGEEVEFEATPMLGAVTGQTDGIAPGCTFSLTWKQLSWYSENEYVIVFADREENFYYNWSELTWEPLDWLGAGLVTQRTRVYQTDRDLQRGLLMRFTRGSFSAAGYWLNPGSEDDFGIVSLGLEF